MSQNRLLLLIIILICVIALFSFMSSPYFSIRDYIISGNRVMSKNDMLDMLSNFKGNNIWMIDNDRIKNRLLNNNYVKTVEVKKNYPGTIKINITERQPLGKINNNGHYLVFDKTGYILEEGSLKSKARVPLITNVGYSFSNNKITFLPVFKKIVQALSTIELDKIEKIELIKKDKDNQITLKLDSNIDVYLGKDDHLSKKIEILSAIIDKIKKQELDVNYIDLKMVEKPVIKLND